MVNYDEPSIEEMESLRRERDRLIEVITTLIHQPEASHADVWQMIQNILAMPRFGARVLLNVASSGNTPTWKEDTVDEVWKFLPSEALVGFTTKIYRYNCHAYEENVLWKRIDR